MAKIEKTITDIVYTLTLSQTEYNIVRQAVGYIPGQNLTNVAERDQLYDFWKELREADSDVRVTW